ncbi:MAG: hypothetical protein M1546_25895 [Chloroflexi bacterium]|nr:hypothetical protein [Chloroflexota bacterium]
MQKQKLNQNSVPAPVATPSAFNPAPRSGLRPTRIAALAQRIITILVVAAIAVAGLAALDNALAPSIHLARVTGSPDALAVVRALEVDAQDGTLYAGSNAGVFKSSDGGATWLPAGNGLPGIDIQDLFVDRRDNSLYAVLFGVGLFRSTDGAQTWQGIGRGMRGSELLTLALDERNGMMFAGLRGYGFYTSLDNGESWETGGMGLTSMTLHALLPGHQPGELFAASDQGIFHSTQITVTWEELTEGLPQVNAWSLALDAQTGTLFAGTDQGMLKLEPEGDSFRIGFAGLNGESVQAVLLDEQAGTLYAGTLSGVYRSDDAGATWTSASTGLNGTLVRALLQKPDGSELLAATDSGIHRSTDRGTTWQPATQSPAARHAQAMLVDQQDGTVYAGTLGGGIFVSTDAGASWQPFSTGLRQTVIQALAIDHGAGMLYAATPQGVYRSPLDEAGWTLAGALSGADVIGLSADERRGAVFAVTTNGDVYRSTNAGTSWDLVQPLQNVFARTVAVSSYASAVYAGAYKGGVAQSRDGGFTWQQIGNAGDGLADRNIEVLAVDERLGTIFAGTFGGNVFYKADERSAWQKLGQTLPGTILALTLDESSGTLFAALKAGLYRIAIGEQSWQPAISDMSHSTVQALAAYRSGNAIYAGTLAGGVFRSTDSGQSWVAAGSGLTDIDMRSIVADAASGALIAGTTGRGVFRSEDNGATWRPANIGLKELTTRGLANDPRDGSLFYTTQGREYISTDGGNTWQTLTGGGINPLDFLLTNGAYGFVGRLPSGQLLWTAHGGGLVWARTAANLGLVNGTLKSPESGGQVLAVWGAELTQTEPGAASSRVPLAWMLVRMGVWSGLNTLNLNAPWWWLAIVAVVLLAILAILLSRVRLSRAFGVPLPVALFTPGRSTKYARPQALDVAWPRWERSVQSQLYGYGEVKPVDLPRVPGPFRLYALQRFAQVYGQQQSVTLKGDRLSATARDLMNRWVNTWQAIKREVRQQSVTWQNRKRADTLAEVLAGSLGLKAQPPRDVESVRAYATVPTAEAGPTLQSLAMALHEAGNEAIGLVIPLGRPGRDVDMTSQVRAAVAGAVSESEHARRLIVLSDSDILNMMASHDPAQTLAARLPR